MTSYVTPKKNTEYIFYISVVSQANTLIFQANPTIASGDFKVAVDDAAPANLTTLPVVDADFTKRIKVTLSALEMNGDNITFIGSDAAGSEWCDITINIQTTATQIDNLVRSTTPANTLDIAATGEAGLDFDNIKVATGATTLTNITVPTVSTLTGHTAQTGDSFARIGVAGAGLTNVDLPNQTMDITGNITGNLSGSVGSVTAAVVTDAASRTASKADVSNLDAAISTRAPASEYDTEMARITANVATETKQDLQATLAEQAKVPKSDGTVSWNATALASIETQVDNGVDNVLGTPTAGSLGDYVKRIKFIVSNEWDITESNGNSDIKDDVGASFSAVASAFTSLAGITTRKKII